MQLAWSLISIPSSQLREMVQATAHGRERRLGTQGVALHLMQQHSRGGMWLCFLSLGPLLPGGLPKVMHVRPLARSKENGCCRGFHYERLSPQSANMDPGHSACPLPEVAHPALVLGTWWRVFGSEKQKWEQAAQGLQGFSFLGTRREGVPGTSVTFSWPQVHARSL